MPTIKLRTRLARPFRLRSRRKGKTSRLRSGVWTAGRLLVLAVALSVTFGVFFLASMRIATRAREVRVPDISGQSIADAGQALTNLGLVLRVDPLRRSNPEVPIDHVVSQDPTAGSVIRRQRAVRVRLSDGQREPLIPDLTGRPERTADATLTEDNILVASRAEIRTTDYPTDTVVAQDPPGDGRGGSVSLLVNRGERSSSYVVPDLIGTFGEQATAVLRARGFRVTIVAEVSYPGLPSGVVVRQTPEPGFRIAFGEAISLEVSR